jgi:hypothetical protein
MRLSIKMKWVLHFKCRNNNKFSQKQFLEYIMEIIGTGHSVDFKNPDYTIFVEIQNVQTVQFILNSSNSCVLAF